MADSIDRISPTKAPEGLPVLHQNWHHLLFLHWQIEPEKLRPLIPPELTIDTFDGKAYIGVVPFTLTGVRPMFVPPVPFISEFHEINVRTYVHRNGRDPGVWFFSLDASQKLAVAAARAFYKLPYFPASIDFTPGKVFQFHSRRDEGEGPPATATMKYAPEGTPVPAVAGTLEHFLIERYILYAHSDRLYRARVHHQPYPVQKAILSELEETMIWAAGIRREDAVPFIHYAAEVNVKVYPLESC